MSVVVDQRGAVARSGRPKASVLTGPHNPVNGTDYLHTLTALNYRCVQRDRNTEKKRTAKVRKRKRRRKTVTETETETERWIIKGKSLSE